MPARLLIVDDEPQNLKLLSVLLSPLGCALTLVGSGREALAAFERERPDLVLLDIRMPDLDGIEVLRRIRSATQGSHVPVVLVTGEPERSERLRGFEAGADEFLEKPVDRSLLLTRVRTLLRLKEAGEELARRNASLERLQSELVLRNAALERLQREQREMTAFIVHDLKNPHAISHLNIDWVSDTLRGKDPDIDEALTDAFEASMRLQTLIEDLLAVSRIEALDAPLALEPIELAELLGGLARAHHRAGLEKRITWAVDVEPGLVLAADQGILQRVLENLVGNALRYTPQDGRLRLSARAGADVEVAVSNTGAPIPEAERALIFEKFRRGRNTAASRGHAGLGLYFCMRAMEAHHGSIAITETPEWPTSFVLRFPATSAR